MRQSSLFFHLCLLQGLATAAASAEPELARRVAAAQATAQSAAACVAIRPFYWEIGDAGQALAEGSIGPDAPKRSTPMAIASASKWIYASYVVERRGGNLTAEDIRFLTFRSGYTRFRICRSTQTVSGCADSQLNGEGRFDAATANRFVYNGGHMQRHAVLMGLGAMDNQALADEIHRGLPALGSDWMLTYVQPQLAGGGASTAGDYARFLRAILRGELQMARLLGAHPVCTNPRSCPGEASRSPSPARESWHYSIGHWVEDDPALGDGAFSSAGAFGFYPWISRDRQYYGVLARRARPEARSRDSGERPGVQSVACGRLIRAAWTDGQARP